MGRDTEKTGLIIMCPRLGEEEIIYCFRKVV